jgi:hypothetical protein
VRADAEQKPLSSTSSIDGSVDGDKLLKDLQEKVPHCDCEAACAPVDLLQPQWDAVENKGSVAIYGGASIVSIWVASAILSAVDSIPLVRAGAWRTPLPMCSSHQLPCRFPSCWS